MLKAEVDTLHRDVRSRLDRLDELNSQGVVDRQGVVNRLDDLEEKETNLQDRVRTMEQSKTDRDQVNLFGLPGRVASLELLREADQKAREKQQLSELGHPEVFNVQPGGMSQAVGELVAGVLVADAPPCPGVRPAIVEAETMVEDPKDGAPDFEAPKVR